MKKKSPEEKPTTTTAAAVATAAEFHREVMQKFPHHLALFFISAYGAGLVVFLAQFFSLTSWHHYGTSLLLLSFSGFAVANAVLYLAASFFQRNHTFYLFWLPFLLLFISGMAFHLIVLGSFALLEPSGVIQQGKVILTGLVLFFVFFLIGLYLGMSWSDREKDVSKGCALSLLGGGAGIFFVLIAGIWISVFYLPVALIILISLSILSRLFAVPYGSFLAILAFLVFLTGLVEWRIVESSRKITAADNQRVVLPKAGEKNFSSSLDALPYLLRPAGQYGIIGTQEGRRIHSVWKEDRVFWALEPAKAELEKARKNLAGMDGIHFVCNTPLGLLEKKKFDLLDMAPGFSEQEDANRYAVAAETISQYMVSLKQDGILSLPVRIDDFPEYGAKMAATVYQALERNGRVPPGQHVLVYRSQKEMRILLSLELFTEKEVEIAAGFCRDNGFDLVWSPNGKEAEQGGELVQQILQKGSRAFGETKLNIAPATWDRPFFYGIIPFTLLPHYLWGTPDVLPLTEWGPVFQMMVFSVFLVLSGIILFLFLRKDKTNAESIMLSSLPYFAVWGMAFALVTAVLSHQGAFFLGNSQDAFAAVLMGMLVFSGIGAYRASGFNHLTDQGIKWSVLRMVICLVAYMFILVPVLLLMVFMSPVVKKGVFLLVAAPVAYTAGISLAQGIEAMFISKDGRVFPAAVGVCVLAGIFIMPVANIFALLWGLPVFFFLSVLFCFMAFWFYPRYGRV